MGVACVGGQAVPSGLRSPRSPLPPRAGRRLDRRSSHRRFAAPEARSASYRAWLEQELDLLDRPVWLAGHSMGGALAVLAAAERPERIARLTLISPAGLPLHKPMAASVAEFGAPARVGQLRRRRRRGRDRPCARRAALGAPARAPGAGARPDPRDGARSPQRRAGRGCGVCDRHARHARGTAVARRSFSARATAGCTCPAATCGCSLLPSSWPQFSCNAPRA